MKKLKEAFLTHGKIRKVRDFFRVVALNDENLVMKMMEPQIRCYCCRQ